MIPSASYTFQDLNAPPPETDHLLDTFVPEMEAFPQEPHDMIESIFCTGGFVFGITQGLLHHAVYACGYDEAQGIRVVDSDRPSDPVYFLSWQVMCDPTLTQQFYRFLSPYHADMENEGSEDGLY
ncbi:MAG: hypothetical protein FJ308_23875 [Planctomycetes bacterium]|nr:hypothetical protein [Planctomycetota bacterium]